MLKTNLKSLSRKEMTDWIISIGEISFRAAQIWSWIYHKNVIDFKHMTNISGKFQDVLEKKAYIFTLRNKKLTGSNSTNTIKFLWELMDGYQIESVYIPEGQRRTMCISTQVGCAIGCKFCATAAMGFKRNLQVHEILEQVLSMQRIIGKKPTNLVIMGMGEPLLNYDYVIKALTILNHPEGAAIGHRKMTISTSGIVPAIDRYTEENQPFKLAISLNATNDMTRSAIMPINQKYPINILIQAAKSYTQKTRKRITFEYVLIKDVNDTMENARLLIQLLHGIPCKVNLIAYNPVNELFSRPEEKRIHAFAEAIRPLCAPVTLRLSKGDDIKAACGQLAASQSDNGFQD